MRSWLFRFSVVVLAKAADPLHDQLITPRSRVFSPQWLESRNPRVLRKAGHGMWVRTLEVSDKSADCGADKLTGSCLKTSP
jgi:hypothetical protein